MKSGCLSVVVASAVMSPLVLAACSSGSGSSARLHPAHRQITLSRSATGGTTWRLVASSDPAGQLCMTVIGGHGDDLGEGGCGFGPVPGSTPTEDYGLAVLNREHTLFYGPVPRRVVRVVASRDRDASIDSGATPPAGNQAPPSSAQSSVVNPPADPELCSAGHVPPSTATPGGQLPSWSAPGKWFVVDVTGAFSCYKVTFYDSAGKTVAQTVF